DVERRELGGLNGDEEKEAVGGNGRSRRELEGLGRSDREAHALETVAATGRRVKEGDGAVRRIVELDELVGVRVLVGVVADLVDDDGADARLRVRRSGAGAELVDARRRVDAEGGPIEEGVRKTRRRLVKAERDRLAIGN